MLRKTTAFTNLMKLSHLILLTMIICYSFPLSVSHRFPSVWLSYFRCSRGSRNLTEYPCEAEA